MTAFLRLAGLPSTGNAAFRAENGSGSTPRLGAGSMLTVPAASATTGDHLDEQTTERVAHEHGLAVEAGDDLRDVVGDVGDRRTGEGLVVAAGGLHRGGVPRPVDGDGRVPSASKRCRHASQLLASSQSPWTNTTGWRPDSLAAATSAASRVVTVVICGSFSDGGNGSGIGTR